MIPKRKSTSREDAMTQVSSAIEGPILEQRTLISLNPRQDRVRTYAEHLYERIIKDITSK